MLVSFNDVCQYLNYGIQPVEKRFLFRNTDECND